MSKHRMWYIWSWAGGSELYGQVPHAVLTNLKGSWCKLRYALFVFFLPSFTSGPWSCTPSWGQGKVYVYAHWQLGNGGWSIWGGPERICASKRLTDTHLSSCVTFNLQRALWVTDRKCWGRQCERWTHVLWITVSLSLKKQRFVLSTAEWVQKSIKENTNNTKMKRKCKHGVKNSKERGENEGL